MRAEDRPRTGSHPPEPPACFPGFLSGPSASQKVLDTCARCDGAGLSFSPGDRKQRGQGHSGQQGQKGAPGGSFSSFILRRVMPAALEDVVDLGVKC